MNKMLYFVVMILLLSVFLVGCSDKLLFTGGDLRVNGLLNGLSVERQILELNVTGSSVYLDVGAIGGGNLHYWINGKYYELDCTTGDGRNGMYRVELVQGTPTNPVNNLVYVAFDEDKNKLSLFVSSMGAVPERDFSPLALISIQDYVTVSLNGPLLFQRMTETVTHNGKGAISWEREKIRNLGALYFSGLDQSLNIIKHASSEDYVFFNVSNGVVFQLHRQNLLSSSVESDGIFVVNVDGSGVLKEYDKIFNLNNIHEISDGTVINDGDSINLVIWGNANYGSENRLFVNLPNGKYTVDSDAITDNNNTAVMTIPHKFRTTGYLIAKLILRYNSADGGTWTNLLTKTVPVWNEGSYEWSTPNYPLNYPINIDSLVAYINQSNAEKIRIVFDDFNTEANYDFITLRNSTESFPTTQSQRRNDPLSYDGNLADFTSAEIQDTSVRVQFYSDYSITRPGVHSFVYEYLTTSTIGNEIIDLRDVPKGCRV